MLKYVWIFLLQFFPFSALAEEKGGTMPQMEVSTFEGQIFWLSVIFILLYFGFSKFFLPQAEAVFQSRKERIQTDIDIAKKIALDAQKIEDKIEEEQKEIQNKARDILQKAQLKSNEYQAERSKKILSEAQEKFSGIEAEMNDQKKAYLMKVDDVAIDLCQLMIKKITGVEFDRNEVAKEINTHIKERELRIAC